MSNTAEEDREAEIDYEEVEMNAPLPDEYYPENPDGNAGTNGEIVRGEAPKSSEESDYPIFPNILFIYGHKYHSVSASQIREHFEPFGKVLDVSCRSNLAFVKFERAEDAARAKSELHRRPGLGSPTIIVDYKKDIPPKSKQYQDRERGKYDRPARNRDSEKDRDYRDGGNQPRSYDNNRGRSSDGRNDRIVDDRNNDRNDRRYDDRSAPAKYDAPNVPSNYRRSSSRDRNYRPNDYPPRTNDREGRNPGNDYNKNDDNFGRDYRDNSRPSSSMNDRFGPPTNNYPPRDNRDRDVPAPRPVSPRDYGRNSNNNSGPSSSYHPRDAPPTSHGQGRGYDNYGPSAPVPPSSRSPPRSHSPPPPVVPPRNYSRSPPRSHSPPQLVPPPPRNYNRSPPAPQQQHKRSYDTHNDNRSGSYGHSDRAPYDDHRDSHSRTAGTAAVVGGSGGRGQNVEPPAYSTGATRYRSPDRYDNRDRDYDNNRDRDYSRSSSMQQPRGADFEQGRGGGGRDNQNYNQPPRDQYQQPPRDMNKRPRY